MRLVCWGSLLPLPPSPTGMVVVAARRWPGDRAWPLAVTPPFTTTTTPSEPVVTCGVLEALAGLTTTLAGLTGADWWLAGSCRLTAILCGLAAGRDGLPPIFPELADALCGPTGTLCGLDTTDWGADTE